MDGRHFITEAEENLRIDRMMTMILPEETRTRMQGWIADGMIQVNGKPVKSNYKCKEGDILTWTKPEIKELALEPENIALDIIYEDEAIVVVNKPKGMVVHPSAGHEHGTLVHALLYHCKDLSGINDVERPGIVHRIDKDTSGLLVVAKNDQAHQELAKQLAAKDVERRYEAIVHGEIQHEKGMIDAPIGRDPNNRQRMAVVDNGKQAITHFQVLTHFADYTHVTCQLETGRTHQIRVHMRYIGHPLVGDPKYGPRKTLDVQGQALHARVLGFHHPISGEWLHFEADPPKVFQEALENIKKMA